MAQDNKTLVRQAIDEIYGKRNVDFLDQACSEQFQAEGPMLGRLNRQEYKRALRDYFDAFPDLQSRPVSLFGDGECVAVHWRAEGTQDGPLMDLEPTRRRVKLDGISIYRCKDGKITEMVDRYDMLSMLRQLGAFEEEEAHAPMGSQPQA